MILIETEFNEKNKSSNSDRAANKEKVLSDINIKKRLNLNWKECKKLFPILDKCPNFALLRLKVIFSYSNMINLNTLILNSYIPFFCRITDYGMMMMKKILPNLSRRWINAKNTIIQNYYLTLCREQYWVMNSQSKR